MAFQAWNAFVMFWTRSAVTGGAPLFFALFSLPFWVVGVRYRFIPSIKIGIRLKCSQSRLCISFDVIVCFEYIVLLMFFSRLAKESLFNFAVSVEIQISMSQFFIQWELGNIFKQRIEGKTKDIDSIKIAVEGVSCVSL